MEDCSGEDILVVIFNIALRFSSLSTVHVTMRQPVLVSIQFSSAALVRVDASGVGEFEVR